MEKRKLLIILLTLGVYLLTTGLSYSLFTRQSSQEEDSKKTATNAQNDYEALEFDPNAKKTEECPLNGAKYSKEQRKWWEDHRPMGIMIENHPEARPQSGLSFADVVYEAVAEGGITRFMGVFYCGIGAFSDIWVAPVRSARTSYVDWVSEYDALYNHVGGAGRCADDTVDDRAKALCQIYRYGIKDLDQFGIGFPDCYRNPDRLDHPVATEHTMVCFSDNLYKIAQKREWTNVDSRNVSWDKNYKAWTFKDE